MNKEETTKLVLEKCEYFEKLLNKVLLPEFAKLHNIEPRFSKLHLKQEVISDKCFFMDVKKRYCMHILNREGKTCDEVEIKGLVTERSEYPSITKEKIKIFLNIVMAESLDMNELNNFIEKTRAEFIQLCEEHSKEISGMASFNKSYDEYTSGGKHAPHHIQAMKLWNDLEYEYFVEGTKGYIFRIHGIDPLLAPDRILDNMDIITMKNKYIVIPFEEEKLPEYYILDMIGQMNYAWNDRVEELIRVLRGESYGADSCMFDRHIDAEFSDYMV